MSDMAIHRQQPCRRHTIRAGGVTIQIIFGILVVIGYFVTPVALIWGWTRWTRQPKQRAVPAILFLTGFVFATASAVLAVSSVAYAQVHHFSYYDPLLLRIFRCGGLLSLAGIIFGIGGMWRPGPLCAGTRLFVGWECSHSGSSWHQVNNRTERCLA